MLFLIFTDNYTNGNVFGKFQASEFGKNNNILLINDYFKSECIDTSKTYPISLKLDPKDITIVIINDIIISRKNTILHILQDIISLHDSVYALLHANGQHKDHHKWVMNLAGEKLMHILIESHLSDTVYYDELVELANAFDMKCKLSFTNAIGNLKKSFYNDCEAKFRSSLGKPKILEGIEGIQLPKLLEDGLFKMKDWQKYKAEIISVLEDENQSIATDMYRINRKYL